MVLNLSKHPDLNPCDCFLFSEPKLQHEGEDLQTRHWQHTWQTNSHSEKFHTYFHKHTVVCCHQGTQLQGGYLEESKFQNCGRTYTDMLQNQSQNFLRVSHDCALVFHHKGPLKYNHACITLVNVCLIQLICWLYTKLLTAREFEIRYSTGLNSHKFIKIHLDYLKYETLYITHIQIYTHYMETTWINIWQLYIWWQPYKWNWWVALIVERNKKIHSRK